MPPARGRRSRPVALALAGLLLVAGCGSSGEPASTASTPASPGGSASASGQAAPTGTVVDITISEGTASPRGRALQVRIGEPVTLRVESDVAGELHVHSTPEQEIAFEAGTTQQQIVLDRPGVVDVEDHGLGQLLVRLEVR